MQDIGLTSFVPAGQSKVNEVLFDWKYSMFNSSTVVYNLHNCWCLSQWTYLIYIIYKCVCVCVCVCFLLVNTWHSSVVFIISFGCIGCSPYTRSNILSYFGAQNKAQGGIWSVFYVVMALVGLNAVFLFVIRWPIVLGHTFMLLCYNIGIEPWTFVQNLGDAVFIPAGCPHQVRNIKVK